MLAATKTVVSGFSKLFHKFEKRHADRGRYTRRVYEKLTIFNQ